MSDPATGRPYAVGNRLPEPALARYRQTAIEIAGRAARQDPSVPPEVLAHLREAWTLYARYAAAKRTAHNYAKNPE